MDQTYSTTSTIFAALSILPSPELSAVTLAVSGDLLRRRNRLSTILSDQTLFSLTLRRLHGISLSTKIALLAQHLLSSLRILLPEIRSLTAGKPLPQRDLDAVLLLLFLCESRRRRPYLGPESLLRRHVLVKVHVDDMLTSCTSGLGSTVLVPYAEEAARCLRLVGADVAEARSLGPHNADVAVVRCQRLVGADVAGGMTIGRCSDVADRVAVAPFQCFVGDDVAATTQSLGFVDADVAVGATMARRSDVIDQLAVAPFQCFVGADVAVTTQSLGFVDAHVADRSPASVLAVVALPSVSGGGGDCAVCREEMREGRDVCRVPCGHVFHWKCVIPWLRETNTCPICRFELPTDDVAGEIRRLWGLFLRMAGEGKDIA